MYDCQATVKLHQNEKSIHFKIVIVLYLATWSHKVDKNYQLERGVNIKCKIAKSRRMTGVTKRGLSSFTNRTAAEIQSAFDL